MPAALEGDQYELWDADDQPLPSELSRPQPQYISVVCDKCGTLMHANEIQAGQKDRLPRLRDENRDPVHAAAGEEDSRCWQPTAIRRRLIQTTIPGDVPLSCRRRTA